MGVQLACEDGSMDEIRTRSWVTSGSSSTTRMRFRDSAFGRLFRILEDNDFDAWAVNDPLKVRARAVEIRPDLIILDCDMPKLLGPEVSVVLKGTAETCNIPVIFLSGMTDEDHHAIGALSGAAAYLEKPLDQSRLIETIRALLRRHDPPR